MVLGSTAALWGLGGMMIPLIIHLLSKQKQKEIEFGSIQFLEETASDRSRSIQLSQVLLLVLRMLIVGLMTMIAAQLLVDKEQEQSHQVYVPHELMEDESYTSLMERYTTEEYEVMTYQHDRDRKCEDCLYTPSLTTLLLKANKVKDSSTVITYGYKKDIRGSIPSISAQVNVIQIPKRTEETIQKITIGDTLYNVTNKLIDNSQLLQIENDTYSQEGAELKVCIRGSTGRSEETQSLQNVISSISQHIKYPISYSCENPDWIVTVDTIMAQAAMKNIYWTVGNQDLTWSNDGYHNYNISGRMNTKGLRSTNLPLLVAEAMSSSMIDYDVYDTRTINLSEVIEKSKVSTLLAEVNGKTDVSKSLWLLLILALYGERRLSNQASTT